MLYYFDETADQGYIDKATNLEEYGLIGGYSIPSRNRSNVERLLYPIYKKLEKRDFPKIHCSQIFKDDNNEDIKQELYNFFQSQNELLIVYEAQYLLGVKNHKEMLQKIIKEHANVPKHIKMSSNKKRIRLYNNLLIGVIIKLEEIACIEDESEVLMISDHVDKKLAEEAKKTLAKLQSKVSHVTAKGFDTKNNLILRQHSKIETKSELRNYERVKEILFEEKPTPLTFAADFICFELLRHFRRKMKGENVIRFHAPEILEGFPLAHKIASSNKNYFSDNEFNPIAKG